MFTPKHRLATVRRTQHRAVALITAVTLAVAATATAVALTIAAVASPGQPPPGMGSTAFSGPVTHPGADHAGSGLERLMAGKPRVALPASSSSHPLGMDVSVYQGNVNWGTAARDGARFAYVKATESTGYVNPSFGQQYGGAHSAGLIRGAYHFALPGESGGAAQADYFISNGGGWSPDGKTLPGALDIEYNPYGPECYGLSQGQMVSWVAAFLSEYHARTSRWPVIYSTTDWWSTCTGNYGGFGSSDPLWLACYCGSAGTLPAGWGAEAIWQYSDTGTLPGDQNLFNGDINGLQRLAAGTGAIPAAVSGPDRAVRVYATFSNGSVRENRLPRGGTWSGFYNMGGNWPGNPAALADTSGYIRVYAVGTNGSLYENYATPGGTWSGWGSLGSPGGGLKGDPAVIKDRGGIVRVYARGTNGNLYEDSLAPGRSWSGFYSMGGVWPANPTALADTSGNVHVLATGTTGMLYEKRLAAGRQWSGWTGFGGSLTGKPAAVQDSGGSVRVYARGTNGHLYEDSLQPGKSWTRLYDRGGGPWPDDPAALTDTSGNVHVFAVGSTGHLYEDRLSPSRHWTWSGWISLGGSVTGEPAAVQDSSGTVRVYARGTNQSLDEDSLAPAKSWSGFWATAGPLF